MNRAQIIDFHGNAITMKSLFKSSSSRSEQIGARQLLTPAASVSPEERVRAIVAAAIAPAVLPATKDFQVHYIRGVDNANDVVFNPEFLYLLDVGFDEIAGVSLMFSVVGLGDPAFPDFGKFQLRAVQSLLLSDIIFPATAGRLLITVAAGTTPDEVEKGLADYALRVEPLGGSSYVVFVTPFSEKRLRDQIARISFVTSADFDWIVRIIDGVSWLEDRIA